MLGGQLPGEGFGSFPDLVGTLGSAEGRRNARSVNRPVDDDLCNGLADVRGDLPEIVDKVLIPSPLIALKHWVLGTPVARFEDMVAVKLTSEEAFHQRPIDDRGGVVSYAPRQNIVFDLTLQHVERRLHCGYWTDGMELVQLFDGQIRGTHGPRLASIQQLAHRAGGLDYWDVRIRSVQVQQIDTVSPQANQAPFALVFQRTWSRVLATRAIRVPMDAPFGSDHDFIAMGTELPRNQTFALTVSPVTVSRIKEIYAGIESGLQRRQAIDIVDVDACHASDRPASHRDGRDVDIRRAEFSRRCHRHGRHDLRRPVALEATDVRLLRLEAS